MKQLDLVQGYISNTNPIYLSEFKRNKLKDFKDQKIELEKNKLREGKSYHYETMITRILDNLDFYLRNEILVMEVRITCCAKETNPSERKRMIR